MERLPMETEKILQAFQKAKAGTLSVKKLKALLPEADAYQVRIGQLSDAKLIEPCAWEECQSYDVVIDTGAPTAFRITVKGMDYLAMLDQQRKQRSKKRKQKELDDARAEKQNFENRRYDRHTAIIANIFSVIIGSVLTLFIEHHNEIIVWVKTLFSR